MKKRCLPLLLVLALLLTGCADKNRERFDAFADSLRARGDVSLRAVVRAEYDDRTLSFTLACREEGEGGCTVEVIEPELIRGVKAHLKGSGAELLYEDVRLDTGDDGGTGLSPMRALPLLLYALREGTPDSFWTEEGCLAVRLVPEDDLDVTVLFDETMLPRCAEIAHKGVTVLFIEINEFD